MIDQAVSQRITVARVLCILGVIYVHMPPYDGHYPLFLLSVDGYIWFIRNTIGLSSVPLLSIVSGYLAIRQCNNWRTRLRKKLITLIAPLALWNAIALLKDYAESSSLASFGDLPNQLLALSGFPRLTPLYFLRDVFVCNLLLPALARTMSLCVWPVLLALGLNAVLDFDGRLLLNSHIGLFFSLGIALGMGKLSAAPILKHRAAHALLSCLMILASTYLSYVSHTHSLEQFANMITRLFGAIVFWIGADTLRGSRIAHYEPIVFCVFCSHPLVIGAMWSVVQALGGADGTMLPRSHLPR